LASEVVGDDVFATNLERFKHGIGMGSYNAILFKVSQIGTHSEVLKVVRCAYDNGYRVMPCNSRGKKPTSQTTLWDWEQAI
jgi:enolase